MAAPFGALALAPVVVLALLCCSFLNKSSLIRMSRPRKIGTDLAFIPTVLDPQSTSTRWPPVKNRQPAGARATGSEAQAGLDSLGVLKNSLRTAVHPSDRLESLLFLADYY